MNEPAAGPAEPDRPGRAKPPRRPAVRASAWSVVRAVGIVAALITAYYLLPLDKAEQASDAALLACGLLGVLLVFLWELRAIARSPHPRLKAVEALAATLVLFLVLFAGVYYLLEDASPGSFSEPLTRTDALYFTLTTFTTVGFGDITARSQTGRVLTMLQMTGGLLIVGVAARILSGAIRVGLQRQGRRPPPDS
ncbi:potassium channel family protein [Streptomyces griseus]|uniref:potassium channel family protein n=1 Tax=Streptomyces griseus TaxID=1911 RepID=UPI00099C0ABD|nr:potassium channel family protein [Streptomyces griseus]